MRRSFAHLQANKLLCTGIAIILDKSLHKATVRVSSFCCLQFERFCRPYYTAGFNAYELVEAAMVSKRAETVGERSTGRRQGDLAICLQTPAARVQYADRAHNCSSGLVRAQPFLQSGTCWLPISCQTSSVQTVQSWFVSNEHWGQYTGDRYSASTVLAVAMQVAGQVHRLLMTLCAKQHLVESILFVCGHTPPPPSIPSR